MKTIGGNMNTLHSVPISRIIPKVGQEHIDEALKSIPKDVWKKVEHEEGEAVEIVIPEYARMFCERMDRLRGFPHMEAAYKHFNFGRYK